MPVKQPASTAMHWRRGSAIPPAVKPMAPGKVMSPNSRGMPNLNLTELQIDQLVAYLQTLK